MFIGSYRVFLDDSIVLGGEWIICILVFNHLEGIIDTKKDYETNKQITRGQSVKERKKKQERRQSVVVMLIRILIYYSLVARPTVRSPG